MNYIPISEYESFSFSAPTNEGYEIQHDVYCYGSGKILVIIQELPGIGEETLALAKRFVDRGYKVYLPHLFGPLGKISTLSNVFRVFCMRKEFKLFAANQSSPIVDWLKSLCRKIKKDEGVSGVAVIGMCLTGNFAISLMADESVLAGYASQPSLPLLKKSTLHMTNTEIDSIKTRLDKIGPMMCGRFDKDRLCTSGKFKRLDETFNEEDKKRILLRELGGKGHSILTLDFVRDKPEDQTQKLLTEVIEYFDSRLEK